MEPSKAPEPFLKPYNPEAREPQILELWENSGYANPDVMIEKGIIISADAQPYAIVLPPPNVTGTLHMGHAAMLAIEDILIRYHRMRGFKTLWLPGTDSAAIATQSKVEKEIAKSEKKSRHDLGREELLKRIDAFTEESKTTIINQTKKMGSSLDWSRYAYTMDDQRYSAVMEAFVRMYDAGLIYRRQRVVNWDPKGQTTISDDEIVYEERSAKLITFKYSKDFPIAIATTRLETKVGDSAVAVHPDDARYKEFIGNEYDLEFCGVPLHIKIIADESVDPTFGTGALGVTPAHSMTDWEIADRHSIQNRPQVINEYAKMTVAGELNNKKVLEAREMILEWLKREDLFIKEETITQNVSTAERTGGIIEPLPKLQWFISVNTPVKERGGKTLKELMRESVSSGGVSIMPERFEKIYFHWIDNLRDWCISRQIWFGHRIPAWFKGDEVKVQIDSPGNGWEQDPDTLDTWFSSGLWTFSTLGWPAETADLKTYHPMSVLETGYDILFFWVARMILMSQFFLGEVPFRKVYLHGLVRDGQGRKMSKSLGNIIDPLTMIEKYGADAARLSLIIGAAPGNDIKLSEDRVRGYKHFANKVWNITRFVLENAESVNGELNEADQELVREAHRIAVEISNQIENFRLDLAADAIYHYLWDRVADEIIEQSKPILKGEDAAANASRQRALYEILTISLKLLHPFMPFVTEAIWQELPQKDSDLLMIAKWPTA
ncbi:MAG TPA: valine--tRNA ligase [Candidatus Paceibacterota bacterium]|nr:valine--tRNA ligase [Candidatus Paceibacterota bacterium]